MSRNDDPREILDQAPASPEESPDPAATGDDALSRRRFLRVGSSSAAALMVGGASLARAETTESVAPAGEATEAPAEMPYYGFCEPPVEHSRYGVLDTRLRVVVADVPFAEPTRIRYEKTRTYNGIVPGPTFRVQAGDRMQILLKNELPPNPDRQCPPPNHNIPHCFNTTNLHTHGLHVSPLPPSDDIYLRLDPGEEIPICIELPEFHAPGTYWYHAHKHGSTAIQLVNGMSGALIVDDPPGTSPVPGARDVVMVLQEVIGMRAEAQLYEVQGSGPGDVYNCMGGSPCSEEFFTINGCYQPTLNVRPGEIQRWRIINATATPRGYTNLQFLGLALPPRMCLIAVDGIYLKHPQDVRQWLMVPGGRADFLVQFPSAGEYRLMRVPTQGQCQPQPLVRVRVGGPTINDVACPGVLPALPPYLAPITDEEWREAGGRTRKLTFDVMGQGDPSVPCWERFLIDGQPFDPDRIDQRVELGAVERWEVTNTSNASHPFHIHVNPFQVIQIGKKKIPLEKRFWQDTVDLPPMTTVVFYSRFQTFHGRFVLHCHILNHEDWGMMQNVEVVGHGVPPCVPVP